MAKAKKSSSKKTKPKAQRPKYAIQRRIEVRGAGVSNLQTNIIDVPMFLSRVNHRLYRQSRNYRVKVNLNEPNTRSTLQVFALRDTWFLQKAYQLAKDTFDKNAAEEKSGISPTQMARWNDFRIRLEPKAGVTYTNLLPAVRNDDLALVDLSGGEIQHSIVFKEDGSSMAFGLHDVTNARWGIMQQYDKVANTSDDPANVTADSVSTPASAYSGLDDDNQDAMRVHLSEAGNTPPYDPTSLNGNMLFRKVATIGGTSEGVQKLSSGFFDAPLGLVLITAAGANGEDLEIEVQAGDYKGVHAATYIDVTKGK